MHDTGEPTRDPEGHGSVGGSRSESSLDLLRRARAGEADALSRLYERYLPALRRWATGRLPRRARELLDTDDLVQEALLHTLRTIENFEPRREGALLAYLRQAVLNRIRGEIRNVKRRPRPSEIDSGIHDPGPSPLEETIGREAVERYEAALVRLRDEDREAIIARIEMGRSYREVADALGKPTANAARMAVQRALLRLVEQMSDGS
jgi:RNA polymerase sigma-70 factor (ECF subfamily)